MTPRTAAAFEELSRSLADDPSGEIPDNVGRLEALRLREEMRLRREPQRVAEVQTSAREDRWLTPSEACDIAQIPERRLYSWARGKRWASSPSRKCLRINERLFREWLTSRSRARLDRPEREADLVRDLGIGAARSRPHRAARG